MRYKFPHLGVLILPWVLLAIGAVSNILAVTVNQGYMPVAMSAIMRDCHEEATFLGIPIKLKNSKNKADHEDDDSPSAKKNCTMPQRGDIIDEGHRVMQSSDHLKFLCDWIALPHQQGVLSLGDLFLFSFDWLTGPCFVFWLALLWRDYNPQ